VPPAQFWLNQAKTPLGEAGFSNQPVAPGGAEEGNRLTDQFTAPLFRAYFVAIEFGFAVCGRISASVSQFVATMRQATVATTPRSSKTPRALPRES
jgi:hypothetical protein